MTLQNETNCGLENGITKLFNYSFDVSLSNFWRQKYSTFVTIEVKLFLLIIISYCHLSHVPGAFLIPYLIMLFLCGIPLLFMEFTVGQYTRLGPVHALAKICPLFKGEWSVCPSPSYLQCSILPSKRSPKKWAVFLF